MSIPTTFIIHTGGQSTFGASGFNYDASSPSARSRRMKLRYKPTFAELLHKLSVKLELAAEVRICRVIYKCPVYSQGAISWATMDILDDDDIEQIYENFNNFPGYSIVEVIVMTEEIAIGDPENELNNFNQMGTGGEIGDGPSMDEVNELGGNTQYPTVSQSEFCTQFEVPTEFENNDETGTIDASPIRELRVPNEVNFGQFDCVARAETAGQNTDGHVAERTTNGYLSPSCDPEDDDEEIDLNEVDQGNGDEGDDDIIPSSSIHVTERIQNLQLNEQGGRVSGQSNLAQFQFSLVHHTSVNFDEAEINMYGDFPMIRWDGVSELCEGLAFTSKDEVKACVKKFSILNNVSYKVVESKPTYWAVCCTRAEVGCPWRLRAIKKRICPYWSISVYKGPHNCNASAVSQHHRQLDSQIICDCILEMVSAAPDFRVSVIIADMRNRFNYDISYSKAWYAKTKALEEIFGNYEGSYGRLPGYMKAMETYNPGTAYDFVVDESMRPNCKQFKRLFWVFKPCIEGLPHCKPVLLIDGTFLTGKFHQTLLIATSVDGNNFLYPVAFAIVESENKSSWSWFMTCIRRYVTRQSRITVISDRHAGIMALFRDDNSGWKEPLAFHRFCLLHFVSNYNTAHRNSAIKDMLYKAGNNFQPRKFTKRMDEIKALDIDSYNWAMQNSLDKWTLSHDNGHKYDHATTNIAESVNSALKGVRMMPVSCIVEHVFARLVKFFDDRRCMYRAQIAAGNTYTQNCLEEMEKRAQKASGHRVQSFDRRMGIFTIRTRNQKSKRKGNNTQSVNLDCRHCECGKFQGTKMPCSHAIAACMHVRVDMWSYVDKCYKLTEALSCYNAHFQPLAHRDYWPSYVGPTLVPDPELIRKKGRPRTSRYRNEMDRRDRSRPNRCTLCRNEGHNRKTCPNAAGPSNYTD